MRRHNKPEVRKYYKKFNTRIDDVGGYVFLVSSVQTSQQIRIMRGVTTSQKGKGETRSWLVYHLSFAIVFSLGRVTADNGMK